jgi:hypothetical protein
MLNITLTNSTAIESNLGEMPERTRKAMVRALNRGINSARTVMVARISKDTGLKSKDVRDALPVKLATFDRPVARLATSLKRIPLIKFNARGPEPSRGRGRGVTYRLGGGRGRLEHAFIARMSTGHRGVFYRRGQNEARVPRLPIGEAHGPSLGRVFAKYRNEAIGIAYEFFDRNFARELKYYASQGAGAPGGAGDAGTT